MVRLFLGVLLVSGCLPDPDEPPGMQLYRGQQIENITSVALSDGLYVRFEERTELPIGDEGGKLTMKLVRADGTQPPRTVISNRSDRFAMIPAGGNEFWAVTNERFLSTDSARVRTGELTHFDLEAGILETLPDISQYSILLAQPYVDWMWFQRPVRVPESVSRQGFTNQFVVRNGDRKVRTFEGISGAPFFESSGRLFFVAGSERTLYRLNSLDGVPQPLRSGVTRRAFSRGKWVAMVVPENNVPNNVIMDLDTQVERRLPGERICCWLGFEGNDFVYSEGAANGVLARLWRYNVETGEATYMDMPLGLADVSGKTRRPGDNTELLRDSRGAVALFDPDLPEGAQIRLLDIRPTAGSFIRDGAQFLYVDLIPGDIDGEGRLMIMDGDFASPPIELTPTGTKLRPGNYFEMNDHNDTEAPEDDRPLLVFWARFGRAASDLYFADLETLTIDRKAEGIRDVSVTPDTLFGIIRTSLQDLVGELVMRDLRTGEERVIASRVDNFEVVRIGGLRHVVYFLRNRAPTDQDGLWITPIDEPESPMAETQQ